MADRDDVLKRIFEKGATREDVAPALDALGVPDLPPDLRAKAMEADESDVQVLTIDVTLHALMDALRLCAQTQARCGVCRDAGGEKLCAHCTAEALVLQRIITRLANLTRITAAAFSPGSRCAAIREAREERSKATEPKSD